MHDAQHFRLSPTEALMLDPQTRLLLEVSIIAQGWYKATHCKVACLLLLVPKHKATVQRAVVVCLSALMPDQRSGAAILSQQPKGVSLAVRWSMTAL